MLEAVQVNRACAFCGKREWQVEFLVQGPSAYICNECIAASAGLLEGRRSQHRAAESDGKVIPAPTRDPNRYAYELLRRHFHPASADEIVTATRVFPARMRADLQRAIDAHLSSGADSFHGLNYRYSFDTVTFAGLLEDSREPVAIAPARYEEVDIGEAEPMRCLENGLWLRHDHAVPYAVYLTSRYEYGRKVGAHLEVAVLAGTDGERITKALFAQAEAALQEARSYRGKVLSLEQDEHFSGQSVGVTVHRIEPVRREEIILPDSALGLVERNVVEFARSRPALARLSMPVKKGLLFHGAPGTGKTYTIRYLAGVLPDHTTLMITAEQVGLLKEYIALARLLQPSIVVIEDADLIARSRTDMNGPCEESLLNRLLNEMDGLREDAQIIFILTTNRPEALEPAITNRPGRIDQAIEFPLPDFPGRRRLAEIYGRGLPIPPELLDSIAARTQNVSPAFIKELMRRAAQYYVEEGSSKLLSSECVDRALQEMAFSGGRLNVRLLGGDVSSLPQ